MNCQISRPIPYLNTLNFAKILTYYVHIYYTFYSSGICHVEPAVGQNPLGFTCWAVTRVRRLCHARRPYRELDTPSIISLCNYSVTPHSAQKCVSRRGSRASKVDALTAIPALTAVLCALYSQFLPRAKHIVYRTRSRALHWFAMGNQFDSTWADATIAWMGA